MSMTAALRTVRAVRATTPRIQSARFSAVAQRMAGETGSTRSGGAAQGDAFQKREEASENLYIKQQEQEKLKQLKAKIAQSKEQLAKDEKDLSEMEKTK
ncbi:mitochondrial ATPase inhibitor-like protein [Elsinoe australis]|uniref:ATPase inhibitor, mitochondrial n=1 Tax=Elsinoe australis TaxID=40998 RepID=A0A4U7AT54_9PEZI|nr:mitochondrial ATPase inhibitor-like protein [Elsinoe australis]